MLNTLGAIAWAAMACFQCFGQDFTIDDDGARVLISERGQPVLGYTYKATGASGKSTGATGYFHPIHGLFGEVLTGESPANGSGAPGIQWGWSRIGAGAKVIDLARGDGGRREFERLIGKDAAGGHATVAVQNVWLAGPEDRAQVIETVMFTVHSVIESQRNVDVSVLVKCVASEPIFLQGSIPGSGLSFVFNPERADWNFAGGPGPLPSLGTPFLSPFMICSYRDGQRSSRSAIAVFQDARNLGFAQPNWLIETPLRLVAGVPEAVKVELEPGEFIEFRYRFVLCHLKGAESELAEEYAKFMAEGQGRE